MWWRQRGIPNQKTDNGRHRIELLADTKQATQEDLKYEQT